MRSRSSSSRKVSARVPPLTSLTMDGEPYRRYPDVEAEIAQTLERPRAEWAAIADGLERITNEALVFLIRETADDDRDLCGRLIRRLSKSIVGIAQHWAQGLDPTTTEEIILRVEIEIIELVLAETPSRQSEYLEACFGKAVERRTINAVEKRKHSPLPLRVSPPDISDDETEQESPEELVADETPGPEEIVAQLQDEARRRELILVACKAVKNPRHLEAVILRYIYDWPVTGSDPAKPTLARRFNKSGRQIQNWINRALEAMRAAIGDKI